jgi:hypothetical protein
MILEDGNVSTKADLWMVGLQSIVKVMVGQAPPYNLLKELLDFSAE